VFVAQCLDLQTLSYKTSIISPNSQILQSKLISISILDLKSLSLSTGIESRSEGPIATASYPSLQSTLFPGLASLVIGPGTVNLFAIIPRLRFLKKLQFAPSTAVLETVDLIVDYLRGLQELIVDWTRGGSIKVCGDDVDVAIASIKNGLPRLRVLVVNGERVVLGSAWLVDE
jgi:hypothetical protein